MRLSSAACLPVCVWISKKHSSALHRQHKGAICKSNSAFNDTGNHLNLLEPSMKKELVQLSDQKCIKLSPPSLFALRCVEVRERQCCRSGAALALRLIQTTVLKYPTSEMRERQL